TEGGPPDGSPLDFRLAMVEGSKRKFAEADREGQQGFVLSEELRRLEDRVEVADRVLLFTNGPLSIEIDHGFKNGVQRNVGFERVSHGFLRRRRLVSETRLQSRHDGRGLAVLGRSKAQELGVSETGRESSVQLPRQPLIFRAREESARESGGVHLRQRVAEETWVRARGNEQRTVRLVVLSSGCERPQDRLHSVKLPFVQERGECLPVRFGTPRPVQR